MPEYAILNADRTAIRTVIHCETLPVSKPGSVLPVTEATRPLFDPQTQQLIYQYALSEGVVTKTWAVEPLPVPPSITNAQCRVILIRQGINPDNILATINAAPMPSEQVRQEIKARWEYSNHIHRDDPSTIQLGGILGFTPEQMDDIFRAAALIP